jgi:MSHA biogenesis protein MshQ
MKLGTITPIYRFARAALLALCCGTPLMAAAATYNCLGGSTQGNINELNMSSANGSANFLEIKVFDAGLPRDAKFCYTKKYRGGLAAVCETLGSGAIDVYRNEVKIGSGTTAFAAGDYLVLELPQGTTGVNEAILMTAAGAVIDHIQYCAGECSADTAYWATPPACSAQLTNVKNSVKDVARYPDGTGDWTSNTAANSPLTQVGTKGRSNGGLGSAVHHLELQHATGSGITCAASVLTIKACDDSACSAYAGGVSGSVTGGAATVGFTIPAGASATTINFQPKLGAALLGANASPAAQNATTCNFGSPSCTFIGTSSGFVFSDFSTDTIATIPTQTAGVASAPYRLRALEPSNSNPAVCTSAIISKSGVAVTLGFRCINPSTCQSGNLLTVNSTAVPATGAGVSLDFDDKGYAPITLTYEDVGQIAVTAGVSSSNAFVVKPHHVDLAALCDGISNLAPTTPGGPVFCKAGQDFSIAATAKTAHGITARNFGQETPPESVDLTLAAAAGLTLNHVPALSGDIFGAFSSGTATGTPFSWDEVGIVALTPGIAGGDYLNEGDISPMPTNVGRFIPDHFDTAVTQPSGYTYSGQPFSAPDTATVTAKSLLGSTTENYNGVSGFSKAVTLSAWDNPPTAQNPGPGTLTAAAIAATGFDVSGSATGAPVYTFTTKLTAPTTIRLRAQEDSGGDGVSSATTEGTGVIRSGRLRLSNAFGRANADLGIPVRAEYWSGNSWIVNSLDSLSKITKASVALNPNSDTLNGVTVNSDVTLSTGQGSIVLSKPTAAPGSVDLAVNLGGTKTDQSCLGKHPNTTGGALPWLRSLNGNCATGVDSDPSARGTFGIYQPETRKVIHIRESFN